MKIGRNSPCPCGSGKKYKQCCLKSPAKRQGPLGVVEAGPPASGFGGPSLGNRGSVLGSGPGPGAGTSPGMKRDMKRAAKYNPWEVVVLPFLARFVEESDSRPCVVIVSAADMILHMDVIGRPSPEVEDLAALLAAALDETETQLGIAPRRVRVMEEDVAEALVTHHGREGMSVSVAPCEQSWAIWSLMNQKMNGVYDPKPVTHPQTWAAWGLGDDWSGAMYELAADWYRASPWKELRDGDVLLATGPSGHTWGASIMGAGGESYGLALTEDPAELLGLALQRAAEVGNFQSANYTLTYDSADILFEEMLEESRRHGWSVAGPQAYPSLLALNAPAGGIRKWVADDLEAILRATISLVAGEKGAVEKLAEGPWIDPDSGAKLEMADPSLDLPHALPLGESEPVEELHLGFAMGPGANREMLLIEALNGIWAEEDEGPEGGVELGGEGPGSAEVDRVLHEISEMMEDRGLTHGTINKHCRNIYDFLFFLGLVDGPGHVPLAALHEMHLRGFLYRWYPLEMDGTRAQREAMMASLRYFFEYLEQSEIHCPWAAPILKNKQLFLERCETLPAKGPSEARKKWHMAYDEELVALSLAPSPYMSNGDFWADERGPLEANLRNELWSRWLLWREETILGGLTAPEDVIPEVCRLQAEWEQSPHPQLNGRTPLEVVLEERASREA